MITFRTASFCDIALIRILADKIWRVSYSQMITSEQIDYMLKWMYSAETIGQELLNNVIWEIILKDDQPIGYISLTAEESSLKLNKLYIDPTLQGQGFGQTALNHVIGFGKENNFKTLYLTVNKGNAKAIKAYEKAGFRCTDSKIFDIGGGFIMDDYIYSFEL